MGPPSRRARTCAILPLVGVSNKAIAGSAGADRPGGYDSLPITDSGSVASTGTDLVPVQAKGDNSQQAARALPGLGMKGGPNPEAGRLAQL